MSKTRRRPTRYIVVTGGVISGLGKGITAASIGVCLKSRGLDVGIQKFDMYLNSDAGTLKPAKHGEVFVTADGGETDLDLGHYERFLDTELTRASSVMQGQILAEIIARERQGGYGGDDVQFIPHLTTAIQDKIIAAGKNRAVHIVELGGTVGDYESLVFVEAVRQLANSVGRDNVRYIHIVYLPFLAPTGEVKTKAAQDACHRLRGFGITPDILIGRSDRPVDQAVIDKLSLFSGVTAGSIAVLPNADTVYRVPLLLEEQGIAQGLANWLGRRRAARLDSWRRMVDRATAVHDRRVRIGLIAKYLDNKDTYLSLTEALAAAAWANRVELELTWVSAEELEELSASEAVLALMPFDGILVPGGFGERGVEGMIRAASYALTNNVPYLGICLGMQVGVIATARVRAGLKSANSREFSRQRKELVIDYMPGQRGRLLTGGTMRLGAYPCRLDSKTQTAKIFRGAAKITGRHRHRFEFNPNFRRQLEAAGLVVAGICPDNGLVEMIELADHDYFLGCQFHPEFDSRPTRPHPLYRSFVAAAKRRQRRP